MEGPRLVLKATHSIRHDRTPDSRQMSEFLNGTVSGEGQVNL